MRPKACWSRTQFLACPTKETSEVVGAGLFFCVKRTTPPLFLHPYRYRYKDKRVERKTFAEACHFQKGALRELFAISAGATGPYPGTKDYTKGVRTPGAAVVKELQDQEGAVASPRLFAYPLPLPSTRFSMASIRRLQSNGASLPPGAVAAVLRQRQSAFLALGAVGLSLGAAYVWAQQRKRPAPELAAPKGGSGKGASPRKRRSGKRHKSRTGEKALPEQDAASGDSDASEAGPSGFVPGERDCGSVAVADAESPAYEVDDTSTSPMMGDAEGARAESARDSGGAGVAGAGEAVAAGEREMRAAEDPDGVGVGGGAAQQLAVGDAGAPIKAAGGFDRVGGGEGGGEGGGVPAGARSAGVFAAAGEYYTPEETGASGDSSGEWMTVERRQRRPRKAPSPHGEQPSTTTETAAGSNGSAAEQGPPPVVEPASEAAMLVSNPTGAGADGVVTASGAAAAAEAAASGEAEGGATAAEGGEGDETKKRRKKVKVKRAKPPPSAPTAEDVATALAIEDSRRAVEESQRAAAAAAAAAMDAKLAADDAAALAEAIAVSAAEASAEEAPLRLAPEDGDELPSASSRAAHPANGDTTGESGADSSLEGQRSAGGWREVKPKRRGRRAEAAGPRTSE